MKYLKKIVYILCLLVVTVYPFLSVYGDSLVLNGYKQVVNVGGENWEGKDSGKTIDNSSVIVSKTISEINYKTGSANLENYFDITLKVQTRTKAEEPDVAIVIVMDVSNTMSYTMSDSTVRIDAARTAAKKFINDFANYSTNNKNIKKTIGFVAFNTDAHQIFALQPCMDASTATKLISEMNTQTKDIMETTNYNESHSRFTNIEAGLKMANDMLSNSNASSKHIIFLSDGFPTTYVYKNYTGYDPYMTPNVSDKNIKDVDKNKTIFFNNYWSKNNGVLNPNDDGIFYDSVKGVPCKYGTSYSDKAAIKAREMATTVKENGINIYSIGVDIGGQKIQMYIDSTKNNNDFSIVDRTSENYEIGDANTPESYKAWLKDKIGSGYYQDVENESAMTDAFDNIFRKILEMSEATWVAEDPMNVSGNVKSIEFVGLYDSNKDLKTSIDLTNGNNTASYNDDDKINWDLKNSNPTTIENGNVTYYVYELHYRIRLQNELSTFEEIDKSTSNSKVYDTNGKTTLNYVIKTDNTSTTGEIDFNVPSVVGYLGELEFLKVSALGDNFPLGNVEFELVHSSDCPCHSEEKQPTDTTLTYKATSDGNGLVKFINIPSGHKYILKETKEAMGHILDKAEYNVEVAYDITTSNIEGNKIINDYLKRNLNISKEVQGNIENSGSFKFTLVVSYNEKPVVGQFPYKNGNNQGTITLDETGKTTIYLKHNETINIEDLPYGSEFKIEELETDGYEVNYKINDNAITFGKSLKGKLESTTNIKFINIGGYIMPETGSSGMLILVIAGILLTGGSVINICYTYFRKKRLS